MLKKFITLFATLSPFFSALFLPSYGMDIQAIDLSDSSKPVVVSPDTGGGGSGG